MTGDELTRKLRKLGRKLRKDGKEGFTVEWKPADRGGSHGKIKLQWDDNRETWDTLVDGKRDLPRHTLGKICDKLEVDIRDLQGGK